MHHGEVFDCGAIELFLAALAIFCGVGLLIRVTSIEQTFISRNMMAYSSTVLLSWLSADHDVLRIALEQTFAEESSQMRWTAMIA